MAASSLHALVVLPGSLSTAQTASVVSMFGQLSTSSMELLVSGAATVEFAIEVSPMLVEGSLNVFGKVLSSQSSRRILAYKSGMENAYSATISASKVQVFAMASSQDAVVTEQAPFLVSGVRRLRSASAMASVIPPGVLLAVTVSVAPDADASTATDVGLVVTVQAESPFVDAGSASLISPTVALVSFDAGTGASRSAIRNVVEAKFPVSQSSHDTRIVVNAAGQRKTEGCVVYDGTRWLPACAVGAYSSASNPTTCTCNMTASILAVAAAEFIVDCSGVVGGSRALDACKTCCGSGIDASKCSSAEAAVNVGVIAGSIVGGCVVVVLAFFLYFRKQRQSVDVQPKTRPPRSALIAPPDSSPVNSRPFARKLNQHAQPEPFAETRDDSPERVIPGSSMKTPTLPRTPTSTNGSVALNNSSTSERQPSAPIPASERYKELLARQRELLDRHTGILAPNSVQERFDVSPEQLPRYNSSASIDAASAPSAGVQDQDRHRRVMMMRQRLSSGGTIIPSDSPALNLPASGGEYGGVLAERLRRLQAPNADH